VQISATLSPTAGCPPRHLAATVSLPLPLPLLLPIPNLCLSSGYSCRFCFAFLSMSAPAGACKERQVVLGCQIKRSRCRRSKHNRFDSAADSRGLAMTDEMNNEGVRLHNFPAAGCGVKCSAVQCCAVLCCAVLCYCATSQILGDLRSGEGESIAESLSPWPSRRSPFVVGWGFSFRTLGAGASHTIPYHT
jgi:hypothetical protein